MTIAERTYEAQRAAAKAEMALFDFDGEGVGASAREEELAALLAAAQEECAALQAEAGGVVFAIYADFREELLVKVEKIARRARKLGVDVPELTWHESFVEEKKRREDGVLIVESFTRRYVAVKGSAPKLAGYEFLASLQHEELGTIVRKVPGTDDIDTTAYRNAEALCAHCRLDRRRKASYLVRHEGGEIVQVGSTCVRDFLGGAGPKRIVKAFEWFELLFEVLEDAGEREGGGFGAARAEVGVEDFLTHVACMMREHGWRSKAEAYDRGGTSTAEDAERNRFNMARQQRGRKGEDLWIVPTEEDAERAAAAIEWVRSEIGAKVHGDRQAEGASDYEHNLYVAVAGDYLPAKSDGIAASALRAWDRAMERVAERERIAEQGASSDYFGSVGDRLELSLTVEAVFAVEGRYGTSFITKMNDGDGNVVKWFGSRRLREGATYVGKWTIKGHDEYRGTKETQVTRPAKLEELIAA